MFSTPLLTTSLAAAAALFAVGPANAILAPARAKAQDHLHLAAHELKHARTALGGKEGNAQQHLSQAIGHIEQAIHHHKTTVLAQPRTGLSGALVTAAHHHHHGQLHEALHAAKEAQKHLAAGKVHEARKEAERAHHHVELAIHHHRV
jgi:hypothetical protein